MSKRWMALGGVVIVVLAALWFFFLRSDNPERVSLDDAVAAASVPADEAAPVQSLPGGADDAANDESVEAGLDGTWSVLADGSSFAGYRVGEELAGIGVTEAVGRTSAVSGYLELEGATLTEVLIEVDMTSLRSDDSRRDGAMGRQALETGAFPTASFVLAGPIDLGAIPEEGVAISVVATGDLTLHGVTKRLEFPLEAQLVGDKIVVVGSADVVYGDFGIALPTAPILVGVNDHGLIELQLSFVRG